MSLLKLEPPQPERLGCSIFPTPCLRRHPPNFSSFRDSGFTLNSHVPPPSFAWLGKVGRPGGRSGPRNGNDNWVRGGRAGQAGPEGGAGGGQEGRGGRSGNRFGCFLQSPRLSCLAPPPGLGNNLAGGPQPFGGGTGFFVLRGRRRREAACPKQVQLTASKLWCESPSVGCSSGSRQPRKGWMRPKQAWVGI